MRIRSSLGGVMVAGLCLAGPAFALEAQEVDERLRFDEERTEIGVEARAGLGGLTGDLGERTGTGPLLGVAAVAQPWRLVGLEAGYEGQRLPIDDARVGDGQAVYRHNFGLLAKAGPRFVDDKLHPFVGAGLGVSYLNSTDGATDFYGNDFVREVPLAAGVDYRFGAISAGARATYRMVYGEEFANPAVIGESPEGNLLNVGVTLGGRF